LESDLARGCRGGISNFAIDLCDGPLMTQYRFRTPFHVGKWYDSLTRAQRFATAIGAGGLDQSGAFVPYRGTELEKRERP